MFARSAVVALLLLASLGCSAASAQSFATREDAEDYVSSSSLRADQFMFVIKSEHRNIVDVEFYSQSRRVAWPGGSRVYSISDYNWHVYVLNCRSGERICFGAGVRGNYNRYWGVGINQRSGCAQCCYVCDGGVSRFITLEP